MIWNPYWKWSKATKIMDNLRIAVSDRILEREGGKNRLGEYVLVDYTTRKRHKPRGGRLILLRSGFKLRTLLHEMEHHDIRRASERLAFEYAEEHGWTYKEDDGSITIVGGDDFIIPVVQEATYYALDAFRDRGLES